MEAPANTMFAFATALDAGADSLELDVHATADGHLVVVHDDTVDATTDGSGRVDALTLDQIQRLDAAHRFVAGSGTVAQPDAPACAWRGVATGARQAPAGFTARDFTIPTLPDVFTAFPGVHINIDIKNTAPDTTPYEETLARLIDIHDRHADVIVGSFQDTALATFKQLAPNVSTAVGPAEALQFWSATQDGGVGVALPHHHALQVPLRFAGVDVVDEHFVATAHERGLAVHVWTVNDEPTAAWLLGIGADGVVTDLPRSLGRVFRGAAAPDGGD